MRGKKKGKDDLQKGITTLFTRQNAKGIYKHFVKLNIEIYTNAEVYTKKE